MKKLFVLSVFVLFGLISTTTYAQEVEEVTEKTEVAAQDKTEIKPSDLPATVAKSISDNFAEYTPSKAFKVLRQNTSSKKNEAFYSVALTKGEESINVLFDSKGNVVSGQ